MGRPGLRGRIEVTRRDPSLRREADMMGFYLAIALLGALQAGNDSAPHTQLSVLWTVWGTTVGLALVHWFAVVVTTRLVPDPSMRHTPLQLLGSQVVMGVVLAVVATLVVLVLPPDAERIGARLTAAVCIGSIVAVESRAGGSTTGRALGLGVAALLAGIAIAVVKNVAT